MDEYRLITRRGLPWRMKRFGRKHLPFWRINAIDIRKARDGKVLEELGFYDPKHKDTDKQVVLDKARYQHWISAGAQPTDTVAALFKRAIDSSALVPAAAPKA
jgi:small subunit ribosomal protein S16